MSDEFAEHVRDLLSPAFEIESGRFFGGFGFKCDGIQFAMIIRDSLYFVVDKQLRPKYAAMGSKPFSYEKQGRIQEVKRYYEVPTEVLEDPEKIIEWAEHAIAASKHKTS